MKDMLAAVERFRSEAVAAERERIARFLDKCPKSHPRVSPLMAKLMDLLADRIRSGK